VAATENGQPGRGHERADGHAGHAGVEAATVMQVGHHLNEAARLLRSPPAPLSPELFRVALRGMAALCGLVVDRGSEAPAQPPSLFRGDVSGHVVAEALGMWEGRIRDALATPEARRKGAGGRDDRRA